MNNETVEKTSICVVSAYSGDYPLTRLADIENNRIVPFKFDNTRSQYFDNRDHIVRRDGPDEVGQIGVWHWTATPRHTDYEKDYVESDYVPEISPVEIKEIGQVFTLDALIEVLNGGIDVNNSGLSTLYGCRSKSREYTAVLCQKSQMEKINGMQILRDDVISLPLYHIPFDKVVRSDGYSFYQYLFLPEAEETALIKSPMDVIRDIIIRRSSWTAMKAAGLSKNEFKHLKEYLQGIPNETLYEEIAETCGFDEETAEKCTDDFIANVDSYLDQEDLDDKVLDSLIENHEDLREEMEEKAEKTWNEHHKEEIDAANQELDKIVHEKEEQQKALEDLSGRIAKSYDELSKVAKQIEEKNDMASSVEKSVQERIKKAQEDAASFITEMAFTVPISRIGMAAQETKKDDGETLSSSALNLNTEHYRDGKCLPASELGRNNNWEDEVDTLSSELYEAGIDDEHREMTAALLYAAFVNKVPVLIAGPNADSVADAFSAAIYGRLADRVLCSGNYAPLADTGTTEGEEKIITICNPLKADWIDHIAELLDQDNVQFFITCPFIEDLVLEPKGLFNYAIPFFTESIVNAPAARHFAGGIREEGFEGYAKIHQKKDYETLLRKAGASPLLSNRIQQILSDMHEIMHSAKLDFDYAYVLLPYFYATSNGSILVQRVEEDTRISQSCKDFIRNSLGEDE